MRKWILIFSIPCVSAMAETNLPYIEYEEPAISQGRGRMFDKTKDALLSFDYIEERADYLVFKLKNLTFGEYSDHVLYIAPVVTGKVEVRAYDLSVYYDYLSSKGGLKYKIKF